MKDGPRFLAEAEKGTFEAINRLNNLWERSARNDTRLLHFFGHLWEG
jgi:hypothetical protein